MSHIMQQLLSRVSILKREIYIVFLAVRLSVHCVPIFYENDLIYCNFFTTQ